MISFRSAVAERAPRWLVEYHRRRRALRMLRRLRHDCGRSDDIRGMVENVLGHQLFRSPYQKATEIASLLAHVKNLQPLRVCEIGTATGANLFLLCMVARRDAEVLSIDITHTPETMRKAERSAFGSQQVTCLSGDSHAAAIHQQFGQWLGDAPLDFLFIDGDHSYDGVSRDYEMYGPLVRPGGVIALHDIVPDFKTRYGTPTGNDTGDVPRFWEELRKKHDRTLEFVEDYSQDGYGIGVVLK